MKVKRTYMRFLLLLAAGLLVLACAGLSAGATPTPVPTNTREATKTPPPATASPTATTRPTSTSRPTATEIPPTPTPAPIGEAVLYNALEITVLDVVPHSQIVTGGSYYYYSRPGETFIDLAVRVRNLNPGNAIRIPWSYIYVVETNGTWFPLYGVTRRVESGASFDAFSLPIKTEVKGEDIVEFDDDTYLRLIYYVADDPEQVILFGIEDSPLIRFQIEK